MKARLVALAIASLAAVGLQPVQADTFFAYQGAPILEVTHIKDDGGTTDADNLQPSKGTRTYHEITVSVVSNGDPDTIDRVTFCLYNEGSGGTTYSAEQLCGYAGGTSDSGPSVADKPDYAAAFRWEGTATDADQTGNWFKDGSNNQHEIKSESTVTTGGTTTAYSDAATTPESLTLNKTDFTFKFALSHATKNTNDWKVRVSTKTTSLGPDETKNTADDEIQGSAIDYDSTANASGNQDDINETYGVYFFAAFSADANRGQQGFGSVVENGSSTITSLDTARYWANDTIDIAMIGTDFESVDSNDTINLVTEDPSNAKAVRVQCVETGTTIDNESFSVPTGTLDASGAVFLADQGPSGENPINAVKHDCKLTYGLGATDGDTEYQNTMTLGLLDANTGDSITGGDFGTDAGGTIPEDDGTP